MTTQPGVESQSEADVKAPGPGAQLRQARLDLKLSPEEVAGVLHLSPKQISALESDDYDNLPGPTYIRGYLRGYAQLLGVSVDPVIEAYNRIAAARKPVVMSKITPPPEIRSDHQLIKFATVAVIVIVLGLSAVWWREQDRSAPSIEPVETTSAPVPADAPALEAVTPNGEPDVATVPAPATGQPAAKTPAAAPAQNNSAVPAPADDPSTASTSTANPATSQDKLKLVVHAEADSWVDVRDANDNRLLYQLVLAGQRVTAEGAAPLAVFLGNAEGVRVELNGQPYDFSSHVRGQIARFNLGKR